MITLGGLLEYLSHASSNQVSNDGCDNRANHGCRNRRAYRDRNGSNHGTNEGKMSDSVEFLNVANSFFSAGRSDKATRTVGLKTRFRGLGLRNAQGITVASGRKQL